MIPVVGNHMVKLGNGENIEQKFNRLFIFYKQVLSKTGFDKYKTIDVQYAGQVVASKKDENKNGFSAIEKKCREVIADNRRMNSMKIMLQ